MHKWKCKKCNYIYTGDTPPKICPNCKRKTEFESYFEKEPLLSPIYDE
ncbi:MAG: hypothetical protein QW625_02915 [Candidatus Nanoarchaeia archaeon]